MRAFILGVILCLSAAWAGAQSTPTGTNFPTALDSNTQLPKVFDVDINTGLCTGPSPSDCTITAAYNNTQASAIRALEAALGADSTWPSRVNAVWVPICAAVKSPQVLAAADLNWRSTT